MELRYQLEGVLFAMGGSVEKKQLAEALETGIPEIEEAAAALAAEYEESGRGIRLIRLEQSYQLGSSRDCYEALIRLAAKPRKPVLTNVVLETLSIIAYRQPITKAEITKIRGVSSDHAVNKLVEYGLVCENGRMDAPGRPILFGTTEEFLRRFGLPSVEELPEISAEKLAMIQEEAELESAQQGENVPLEV